MNFLTDRVIAVDTHTHTCISGHAWSSLTENCAAAAELGMKGLCLTEHGPALENGAPAYIPHSQRMLPDYIKGIRVYKGIEANILNPSGQIDIPEKYMRLVEFGIASYHALGVEGVVIGTGAENTLAYKKVLSSPFIDTIGHADDPKIPCNLEEVVIEAKRLGKLIELNNNRIASKLYDFSRMREYALLCKKHSQRICIGSDAHFSTMVGNVKAILELLNEIEFPNELIVNLTFEGFEKYLKERKERLTS